MQVECRDNDNYFSVHLQNPLATEHSNNYSVLFDCKISIPVTYLTDFSLQNLPLILTDILFYNI